MDNDLLGSFNKLSLSNNAGNMNQEAVVAAIEVAVRAALAMQREEFEKKLNDLSAQRQSMIVPEVISYEAVTITPGVKCEEPLDVVKCLPEFRGTKDTYFSWRQAAHNAFKVYEGYEGSSKYYQAVAIIRNKITGVADSNLTSFNTVLNFKAIIARLDSTYGDKRPIHLVEQEMGTLRQGNQTVQEFYDDVERHLTLLTNKISMSYSDNNVISCLNDKYRADALRVFISGLRRSLSDTLFSARPSNLPTALALAEELEFNRERYLFASNYSNHKKAAEDMDSDNSNRKNLNSNVNNKNNGNDNKLKHSYNNYNNNNSVSPFLAKSPSYTVVRPAAAVDGVEPMDVDPSLSAMRRAAQAHHFNNKPNSGFVRNSDRRKQQLHHLGSGGLEDWDEQKAYCQAAQDAPNADSESDTEDTINFLE